MRKMLAVGAAIALCAGLGTTTTAGYDEVEPSADPATTAEPIEMRETTVTGQEVCDEYCEAKLSDSRVTGIAQAELGDTVTVPGGHVRWGTYTLTGPDGQWIGPYVGHQIGGTTLRILGVLEGSGAYEGWTFIVEWSATPIGSPFDVVGVIYEGSAPEIELPS